MFTGYESSERVERVANMTSGAVVSAAAGGTITAGLPNSVGYSTVN